MNYRAGLSGEKACSDALLGAIPSIGSSSLPLRQLRPALDTLASMLSLLEQLMTAPFPAPAPLPAGSIISALIRLLKMDEGAVIASGRTPPSASMFTELCGAMPSIRTAAWNLLGVVLGAGGASLCPLHGSLCRLINEALRRSRARGAAALAAAGIVERKAMYDAAAQMLHAGGLVSGLLLAAEALAATSVELYGSCPPDQESRAGRLGDQPSHRAQKKARTAVILEPAPGLDADSPIGGIPSGGSPEELSAQRCALELLGALLKSCGPMLPAPLRARLDTLAVHVAVCACDAATACAREPSCSLARVTAVGELHLQALELLLLSVLSPLSHRPPYLSQVSSVCCKWL